MYNAKSRSKTSLFQLCIYSQRGILATCMLKLSDENHYAKVREIIIYRCFNIVGQAFAKYAGVDPGFREGGLNI